MNSQQMKTVKGFMVDSLSYQALDHFPTNLHLLLAMIMDAQTETDILISPDFTVSITQRQVLLSSTVEPVIKHTWIFIRPCAYPWHSRADSYPETVFFSI